MGFAADWNGGVGRQMRALAKARRLRDQLRHRRFSGAGEDITAGKGVSGGLRQRGQ
jgi:hypothetical protein